MISRTLVVCAAPVPGGDEFYSNLVRSFGTVIAVDDGASVCLRVGRTPDLLIGDLDSVSPAALATVEEARVTVKRYPSAKDMSDLDLALDSLREMNVRDVTVTAAWSGRLDHTLAAVGSVVRAADLAIDLADPGLMGWVLDAELRPSLSVWGEGRTVSLFAPAEPAVVSCDGTRYPLAADVLKPLSSLGLSNLVDSDPATITVHAGKLLVLSADA